MTNQHTPENQTSQTALQAGKSPLFKNKPVGNRLYLQVADSLAQLIMTNNLSPGDRLPPERELAQVYEVSRQTIREALIALEVLNLVSIKPGSGVYVQSSENNVPALTLPQKPGYLEIVEGLSHFCGEATFLATQRASNEELLKLNACIKKVAERIENQQLTEIPDLITKAHLLIAQASRNTIVASTCMWLWQLQHSAAEHNAQSTTEQDPLLTAQITNAHTQHAFEDERYCQQFVSCYQEIYELMSRRDAESARKKMQAYLRYLAEYFAVT